MSETWYERKEMFDEEEKKRKKEEREGMRECVCAHTLLTTYYLLTLNT